MSRPVRRMMGITILSVVALAAGPARGAANCDNTSTGMVPLNDLGSGLYLGQFEGGLYPGGMNVAPADHETEGLARAAAVEPFSGAGLPDAGGAFVLLSIGMSNTTQEFCSGGGVTPCAPWTFTGQADVHPLVNHTTLEIANGAMGGQTVVTWDAPSDANYDRVRDQVLAPAGLSEAQVQVLWIKEANAGPTISLPASNADAYNTVAGLANLLRAAKTRYPNARIAFLSNRIYAGYASTGLNPEPYAYETGFAVKWLIAAQINQMSGGGIDPLAGDLDYNTVAPWIAWGPYLWADGTTPRSDGLTYACADLETGDGTHPAQGGETKVGAMLLDFFLGSEFSRPWFTASGAVGDCNASGAVDLADYATMSSCMGGPGGGVGSGCACVDLDDDEQVTLRDYALMQRVFDVPAPNRDPATDDFERSALGDDWLVQGGSPGIIGGSDLGVVAGGIARLAWTGSVFEADQFCEAVVASGFNGTNSVQLTVRMTVGVNGGYSLRYAQGGGGLQLRRDAGAGVELGSVGGVNLVTGDTIRIEVEGSTIRGIVNGVVRITASDAMLTGGTVGMTFAPAAGTTPAAYFESWSGGSL